MIAEIAELFGSRLAGRRSRTSVRRRRASGRRIAIESLEPRQVLNGDTGWIKIDLSNLEQTALGDQHDIYMLGYASSSGQILQKDPATGMIALGTPLPADLVVPVEPGMVNANSVAITTSANLFVGGAVTINGTHTTIKSISANVITANQPTQNGPYAPYYQTGWTPDNNAVVLQPTSVNQGTVSNPSTGSTVTNVPIAAGTQSGIRLDSIINGYFPPSGGMPTADAAVSGGQVTGFTNLVNNSGRYQTPPTVSFPGTDVTTVATGTATLDGNGYVTGVTMSKPGAGYQTGTTYPATFSAAPGNVFFYPSDANGFPGPASATAAATATSLSSSGATMSIGVSQAATPPSWETTPIALGGSALNIYAGGTNASGFATFKPVATVTVSNGVGTVSNVNSLIQFDTAHPPTVIVPSVGIASKHWATGTVTLGADGWLSNVSFAGNPFTTYADGTFSIFAVAGNGAEGWSTPSFTIADLPSTSSVQGFNELLGAAGASLLVDGNPASASIYSIPSYTITFADPVPANATSIVFSSTIDASVNNTGTQLTIDETTYEGIASGLAIGITPTITLAGTGATQATVSGLSITGLTITVTLTTALPAAYHGQAVKVALPPTGGTLPVIKWDKDVNNAIWATQSPNGAAGSISVNGARIYFILDTLDLGEPKFNYSVAVSPTGQETISVTQPPDTLVWQGKVSPFQYIELTADALPLGGDGKVYVDLSAVDGFFFPAALSTTVNGNNILLGQPWQSYTAPNTTGPATYGAVTRAQILDAWSGFFIPQNFPSASALQQAYLGLKVVGGTGIQNPTFAYPTPSTSIPAFDTSWNSALDTLFTGSTQINLIGDLSINGQPSYYKGTQVTVTGRYRAIQFAEYRGNTDHPGDYSHSTPTGASFWVFDPRTPPPTESAAFTLVNGVNVAMSPGYQVFANTGVFASTALVQSGTTPNYSPGSPAWSASDALKQLLALQRDIVTAMNRGIGAEGLGGTTAGATATHWNTETNWYPFAAPYSADTPQNLFSQWVHTAVIDQATNTYFATYPFGDLGSDQNFGNPQKSWGSEGVGTGPFMNQTYGFGYDETPINGANVPSKFLPLQNTAGSQADPLTFQLVFGPWSLPADRPAIDLNGDGIQDVVWHNETAGTYVGFVYDGNGQPTQPPRVLIGAPWTLAAAGYFDADNVTDFVWRYDGTGPSAGANVLWNMNADGTVKSNVGFGGSPTTFLQTSGDYNGDGVTDLVWKMPSSDHLVWIMNAGGTVAATTAFATQSGGWQLAPTGADYDANGDGRSDLIWFNGSTHVVYLMNGAATPAVATLPPGPAEPNLAATGDFNGDGIGDLVWAAPGSSTVVQQLMGFTTVPVVQSQSPVVGDAGTEVEDSAVFWGREIVWRNIESGLDSVWTMSGSTATTKKSYGGSLAWRLIRRPGSV